MKLAELPNEVQEAVSEIKKGFSHIKVELEADLNRDEEGIGRDCPDCGWEGRAECRECEGDGVIQQPSVDHEGNRTDLECPECNGLGHVECSECFGRGRVSSGDDEYCEDFIRHYVGPEAWDKLTYKQFYYDGSVDSEFTFTLPIENVGELPKFIDSFNALAEDLGTRLRTDGAGMHISLLTSGDYCNGACHGCNACQEVKRLNPAKLGNFKSEVQKLLPALYFVASADHVSRSLEYRQPRISGSNKYSAIYIVNRRCLEYRLFETCYERPGTIFDYIQVIASTIKYYNDARLKVKSLGKDFRFSDNSRSVGRFYNTPEKLRILNEQIKHVKPKNKTYTQLKKERNFTHTIASLQKRHQKRLSTLRAEYKQFINFNPSADVSFENFISQQLDTGEGIRI